MPPVTLCNRLHLNGIRFVKIACTKKIQLAIKLRHELLTIRSDVLNLEALSMLK